MTTKFLTLLMAGMLMAGSVVAQTSTLYDQYKAKYPDESAVYLDRSEVMTIEPSGDSLRVFVDVAEDLLLLKQQTDMFAGKRVHGSHFNRIENLKAKTLVWDKSRYKEMNVSEFKKSSDRDDGIFYDDSYYYSFNFPAVSERNRTQLQYRENLLSARFTPGFMFSSYIPQAKTSFTIKTTKDVDLFFKVMNDEKNQINFKKTEKGSSVTYEWTAQDLQSFRSEFHSPNIRYYAPNVIVYVKSYKNKKGTVKLFDGLSGLGDWYYTFIKDLNSQHSEELTSIVKTIKASSKTEEELVKNVYYWVQNNVQYIAFEQGMRGLIPHNGSYVCEKRYGDCKDMANLIVDMLQLAGVRAYHTWIGTRDIPYKYTELPTPLVDNHMIATYITPAGDYIFLDGTSDHTAYGYPSSMIQGKEAFIVKNEKDYEVRMVPVMDKAKNIFKDSITLQIENDRLVGKGIVSLTGYPKVFGGYELDRNEQTDIKKYVARVAGKGNDKFLLDEYKVIGIQERDKPTSIPYAFKIGDYYQKLGDEIYLNLNLNKDYYNDFINLATRKAPMETEYQYTDVRTVVFTIPSGYTIEYLPPNAKFGNHLIGFDISYRVENDKVHYTKELYVDYLLMAADEFKSWNDGIKQLSSAYKESLILKKK